MAPPLTTRNQGGDIRRWMLFIGDASYESDWVESFASCQFLPRIDVIGDWRTLSAKVSASTRSIVTGTLGREALASLRCAMNSSGAFFLPLSVSLHPDLVEDFNRLHAGVFQRMAENCGPIGCRDLSTLQTFEEWSVPAFLSGSLSLTLSETVRSQRSRDMVLVTEDCRSGIDSELRQFGSTVRWISPLALNDVLTVRCPGAHQVRRTFRLISRRLRLISSARAIATSDPGDLLLAFGARIPRFRLPSGSGSLSVEDVNPRRSEHVGDLAPLVVIDDKEGEGPIRARAIAMSQLCRNHAMGLEYVGGR